MTHLKPQIHSNCEYCKSGTKPKEVTQRYGLNENNDKSQRIPTSPLDVLGGSFRNGNNGKPIVRYKVYIVKGPPDIVRSTRSMEKTVVQQTSNLRVQLSTTVFVTGASKVRGINPSENDNDELVKLHVNLKKVLNKNMDKCTN